MAEIYRDKTGTALAFDIAGAVVTKAEFIRGGEVVSTVTNNPTVAVPYAITKTDGPFWVKWYFNLEAGSHERVEEHAVVTPVFTEEELKDWDTDFDILTADKVVYLERLVRQIIQTYTNQKFGYREGEIVLWGNGGPILYSEERIITVENWAYGYLPDGYGIHTGSSSFPNNLNVKIPYQEELINDPLYLVKKTQSVPIATSGYSQVYADGAPYRFTGLFGWVSIPEEVKTAALYIAEAFTCNESLWRERYIKSVRAADWRFDFSEEIFRSTGSLTADQLLDPYVRIGYAVV
jgi:hypothetical protein